VSHESLVTEIADALVALDSSRVPFKQFQPGVGPYGEPQLVAHVARHLDDLDAYRGLAVSKRTPDLLIRGHWALEFKIARPFGDNGKEAENWSVNLLHPYPGNVSVVGDCLKLLNWSGPERRAVVVVGYEHTPPQISLAPLLRAFEVVATEVGHLRIGKRIRTSRVGLIHPVHQQLTVASWEVLGAIEQRDEADEGR
jgi:hypothetical protein